MEDERVAPTDGVGRVCIWVVFEFEGVVSVAGFNQRYELASMLPHQLAPLLMSWSTTSREILDKDILNIQTAPSLLSCTIRMAYRGNYKTFLRSHEETDDQPAYVPPRKVQRNRPESYVSGSPQMRHWKSYLAPELTRPNNGEYSHDYYEQMHDNNLTGARLRRAHQLEGARSVGHLQEMNRLDRSDDQKYRNPTKDDYSRRKDEIMNRIKALQDKTSTREKGNYKNQSQSQIPRASDLNEQQIQARLSSLQARMEQMESLVEQRIEKAIMELESRLNLR